MHDLFQLLVMAHMPGAIIITCHMGTVFEGPSAKF
jgi:hypothetical protein